MRDGIKRMRPMGIADILDETVELYKTSFLLLMGISAVLYVPYSVFNQYLMMRYYPHIDPTNPSMNPMDMLPFIGAAVLGILWVLIVSPFVTGAMTYAISERFLDNPATAAKSFRRVLDLPVLRRIVLAVIVNFVLMLGMMGVWVGSIALCVFRRLLQHCLPVCSHSHCALAVFGIAGRRRLSDAEAGADQLHNRRGVEGHTGVVQANLEPDEREPGEVPGAVRPIHPGCGHSVIHSRPADAADNHHEHSQGRAAR